MTGPTGATGPTGCTGSFQTDYRGLITASQINVSNTGIFGTLSCSGTGVFGSDLSVSGNLWGTNIWSGVQAVAKANCGIQSTPLSSVQGSVSYQHLGSWTAPINGHMLKLNYVSCIYYLSLIHI